MTVEIKVPDIGDFKGVEIIEVLVAEGDTVAVDDGLITLETDKAAMDVPSTHAGKVVELKVKQGDKVSQGDVIAVVEAEATDAAPASAEAPADKPQRVAKEEPTEAEEEPSGSDAAHRDSYDCDVLVLGAGPGGYTAAFRAADLGQRVVLVERHATLGGVCLNVGCIPSKALLHIARVITEAGELADHGVNFGAPRIDTDKLRGFKDSIIKKLTGGLSGLAKQRKVRVVTGEGRFTGAHEVSVGGDTITFANAIIAVGSSAAELPDLPDDPRIMGSTGALELAELPERLLVVGGGIIGLEMATVYVALGVRVSVVELADGLMPGCDRDLVKVLQKRLGARCENIWTATKVVSVKAQKNGIKVGFEGKGVPDSQIFGRVLVAVGRRPNGKDIGADAAGVTVDERGFIKVDGQMRTDVAHVFAIGDVVGNPMLAHKATHEGKVAAEVAAGHKAGFDATVIPSVAYTDPEVAWCGLTETDAKANGTKYEKAQFPWAASGRALALGAGDGFTKLLFDPDSKRTVGAGIVGPNAGDLISEVALAIEMGADAADIGLTIHPHPTLSETVAFSAEAFEGTLTDLYVPKKR